MALKRKRSIPDFSPSPTPHSAASRTSSPNSSYTTDGDIAMGDFTVSPSKPSTPLRRDSSGGNLHSRTRKRFRDGRPDERAIHENTYKLLFSAQLSPPSLPAAPAHSLPSSMSASPTPAPHRRSSTQSQTSQPSQPSLHSFWALPSAPPSNHPVQQQQQPPPPHSRQPATLHCEDCDAQLWKSGETSCEGDMDVDSGVVGMSDEERERDVRCRRCDKMVCGICAVVEERRRECLGCRLGGGGAMGTREGEKKWVGGIGWVGVGYV